MTGRLRALAPAVVVDSYGIHHCRFCQRVGHVSLSGAVALRRGAPSHAPGCLVGALQPSDLRPPSPPTPPWSSSPAAPAEAKATLPTRAARRAHLRSLVEALEGSSVDGVFDAYDFAREALQLPSAELGTWIDDLGYEEGTE